MSVQLDSQLLETMTCVTMLSCKTKLWANKIEILNFEDDNEITWDREAVLQDLLQILNLIKDGWNLTRRSSEFVVSRYNRIVILLFFQNLNVLFLKRRRVGIHD